MISTLISRYLLDWFPVWVFLLAFLFPGYHHIAIALWYIVGRNLNMCFAHMRPPRPRRGFFPLISLPHTQFHLRIFLISFRFGFFACFSLSAPTPRVFPLIFYPAHPVSSSYLSDQLPVWGFFLAFLCLRPRRGFFPLIHLS